MVGLDAAITALRFEDDARVEAEAIRARIRESRVSATEKTRLQAMLDQAVGNLGEIEGVGGNERAIWPYGKAHEKLLAVQAALWRAERRGSASLGRLVLGSSCRGRRPSGCSGAHRPGDDAQRGAQRSDQHHERE